MITFTEKERKWILSDLGEISLGSDGSLQPSITPSMFIESPSSLDLMLNMQKKPSWDCGFTNTSKILETNNFQRNMLNSKDPPHRKRKRKASWGGGFQDKERLSKMDLPKNGFLNEEQSMGYSSISEKVCNLQIQYVAKGKVLLEGLKMESSLIKEIEPETSELLPSKKLNINLGKTIMENHTQHYGKEMRHKTKVPKFVTSLVNSRLKKRLKKLEANEFVEKIHSRGFSKKLQQYKVTQNIVELLMPNEGRVEEGKFTQKSCANVLSATTLANQASNGDILLAPPNSKEPSTSHKRDSLENHIQTNLQLRALKVKWKGEDSLLAGSLEKPKRRIKIVGQHGCEERALFNIEQTKIASSTSSTKTKLVSQRATHVEKPNSKTCHGNKSSNGNNSMSSTWEKARGCPTSKKCENPQIPLILSASTDGTKNGLAPSTWENLARGYPRGFPKSEKSQKAKIPVIPSSLNDEAENHYKMKGPKDGKIACKKELALPLSREENGTSDEDSTKGHINNMEDTPTKEDIDLGEKGGNARIRTKRLLQLFHKIHKQFKGGHKEVDVRNIIVECHPEYLVNGSESIYGDVPGVEAGDRFNYRVEMDLVGLHHQFRRGIEVIPASKSNWYIQGRPISVAACIVVAGGYVDNRDEGDIIIYTGEGGNNHFFDKGPSKDQMLTFGNKALRHSMMLGLYVRVIRKFDIKPPTKPYYRYDGLYEVMEMKKERSRGHRQKALSQRENGAKHKISKYRTISFKPLVYKFVLVRKSTIEKYKDVNLWTYKPPSRAQVLNNDQEVIIS